MDIKGFKGRDGTVHQYDFGSLANKPKDPADGKDGGYYTPVVTQLDTDTVQFEFTPSKSGMPAVAPVTVELPKGSGEDSTQNPTVEPMEDDIPKVFITGVKPTTKDDVLAEMQYISKTDSFHAYLAIKCQGTSSMSYAKKNFTVKMYSDEARETKLKKSFKDWNHNGNKYVLKANFIDHSHARNIVSARLWNEVVMSRPDYASLPAEMRNSPRNGAVDGFPIKVYYNDTYEGIYTWNIGKDDWMWNMDEDNPNHVLLCAETNTDGNYRATPCNFRALWSGVDETDWSVEVGTNSTALKTSLNNLIQFVMDNDGDAFRNGIGNYLDIQSAIDYYIFQYEVCGLDGLAKNMLLGTYDGTLWRCGAYDLDSTFGLWWNGSKFVAATYACPEDYQEQFSLLWERIEANYRNELKARQAELRKTVLSYSNMVTHFERFMDAIGLDLYAEDLTIYPAIPSGSTNNIKQIRNYIRDRQTYVDAEFAAMIEPVPCTGISLDKSTLTFDSKNTQTLAATVTPDGCTDPVTWESDNTSVATVNGGVVTAIANGSATITAKCGEYSASCAVTVQYLEIPATAIHLSASKLTFDGIESQVLTATLEPENSTSNIVWSSDNSEVATVDNGIVTPVGAGSCAIKATAGEVSASCTVTVPESLFDGSMMTLPLTRTAGWYVASDYIEIPDGYDLLEAFDTVNGNTKVDFYDSDKTVIAGLGGTIYAYQSRSDNRPVRASVPTNAKYFVLTVVRNDGEKFEETVYFKHSEDYVIPVTWSDEAKYTIASDGVISETGSFYMTDKITVPSDASVIVMVEPGNYGNAQTFAAAYDADDNFIIRTEDWLKASGACLDIAVVGQASAVRYVRLFYGRGRTSETVYVCYR